MVTPAAREADLRALLADGRFWAAAGPNAAAIAQALYDRPCTADHLDGLHAPSAPSRTLIRARWVAAVAAGVMAVAMSDRVADAVAAAPAPADTHQGAVVRQSDGR
jgi:hypothetical protein